MNNEQLWKVALGQLELRVSQGNFLTWFRGTCITDRKGGVIVVDTPSPFAYEWLSKKYRSSILEILKDLDKEISDVRFSIHSTVSRKSLVKKSNILVHKNRPQPLLQPSAPAASGTSPTPSLSSPRAPLTLNPKYTFDTFVVGSSNELVYAACQAVAEKPGQSYNPLFIYGGVGLGKTHLLQAIGNKILQENPTTRVLYVSSEKFMNDFVDALRERKTQLFKKYYREADVLIIDDVQFLAGKGKTQEELFHTYNSLYSQNKQVILSSDRPPRAIATFEERLSSRLAGGMIVDIKQPDYETRLAILTEKARLSQIEVHEEALMFIAKNVQRNVRELEGALNKLLGYCEFNKKPATIEYTTKVLEGLLEKPQQKNVEPSQILEAVSVYYSVLMEDLCGKSRKKEIVRPRQVAMYLLRKENNTSFPSIGGYFGGRDHTTAMHACEKVEKLLEHDEELVSEVNFIRERIYI